jgi:transcriptional regulator GlxA family with amidase domain
MLSREEPLDHSPEISLHRDAMLPQLSTLRALSVACSFDTGVLAARLRISTRHLRRLFLNHLGCSAASWLREERLQCAFRSLSSAHSVKEVAHALGFRNTSQFCRDFRWRFGATPSEYLRRHFFDIRPNQRSIASACESSR